MTIREEYIRALFALSKSVPPDMWIKFVDVLNDYTADQMERVVTSVPSTDALIAIGMVRHMREFRDEVKNIELVYQKVDKERNKG